MALLVEGRPVAVNFIRDFVTTNQETADLSAPKPETNYCLFEFPEDQLKELVAGEPLCVQEKTAERRGETGNATLTSRSTTFELDYHENSNTLLIGSIGSSETQLPTTSEGSFPECTVMCQVRGQVTLRPTVPDTQRLRDLLQAHALGQAANSDDAQPRGLSLSALQFEVAASPNELQTMLDKGPYVEIDGAWRLLPSSLERDILDVSVSIVTAQGWSPKAVSIDDLFFEVQQYFGDASANCVPSMNTLLKGLKSIVSEQVLVADGANKGEAAPMQVDGSSSALPGDTIVLDEGKVDQLRVLQLLRDSPAEVRRRFALPAPQTRPKRPRLGGTGAVATASSGRDSMALQLEELVGAFNAMTGMESSEEDVVKMLDQNAYVDEVEGTVHPLDPTTLPQESKERLKRLFELKTHWRPEALSALVKPTLDAGVKVDIWLAKYTRVIFVEFTEGVELRVLVKKFAGL